MAFAEGIIGMPSNFNQVIGGIAAGRETAPDIDDGSTVRPIDWLNVRGAGNSFAPGVTVISGGYDEGLSSRALGRRWGDAHATFTNVWTVLPPNSPTVHRINDAGSNPEVWSIVPPSSNHPGGVSTVAADASYRFVSNSVDTSSNPPPRKPGITATGLSLAYADIQGIYTADHVRGYSGVSPWGVWGAYGSKSGGESAPSL